jgi:flagellin
MVINTNIQALKTSNFLSINTANLAKSLSRLSSGSKIVTPSDDAAGLAVGSRLAGQIARNEVAYSNVTNAISFTQTQEGLLATIDKALRRMADLSIFSQDSTKSLSDLGLYNKEFIELQEFVTKSIQQKFNGINLFSNDSLSLAVNEDGSTYKLNAVNLTDFKYQNVLNKPENFTTQLQDIGIQRDISRKTITIFVDSPDYEKSAKSDSLTLSGLSNGNEGYGANYWNYYYNDWNTKIGLNTLANDWLTKETAATTARSQKSAADAATVGNSTTSGTPNLSTGAGFASLSAWRTATADEVTAKEGIASTALNTANSDPTAQNLIDRYKYYQARTGYGLGSERDLSSLNGTYTILNKGIKHDSTGNYRHFVELDASQSTTALSGPSFGLTTIRSGSLAEIKTGFDITTPERAQSALTRVKLAIDSIAQTRASLGAVQSRLTMTNEQLRTTNENLSAATSRIKDTDVAEESTSYAKLQILIQSGTSMLAQANKMPQYALQLLQ